VIFVGTSADQLWMPGGALRWLPGTVAEMTVTVRRLTLDDDLDAIGRIVLDSYLALAGHPVDSDYAEELADVPGRVRVGVVLGAFNGVDPLGCVTYVNDPGSPFAEMLADDEASFRMLAVRGDAQGRGIGRVLVESCLDLARAGGRSAVFIHSGNWMTTAHQLYERLGFRRIAERDWAFPELGFTLFGFRREL
jgi:ribosomal protein S18 acetylase RimI-like enzyme